MSVHTHEMSQSEASFLVGSAQEFSMFFTVVVVSCGKIYVAWCSAAVSAFTVLCSHPFCPDPERLYLPKLKLCTYETVMPCSPLFSVPRNDYSTLYLYRLEWEWLFLMYEVCQPQTYAASVGERRLHRSSHKLRLPADA